MRTRSRRIGKLNYYAGVLGAVSYALARFAFSFDALVSSLIGLLGLILGIILAQAIQKRRREN